MFRKMQTGQIQRKSTPEHIMLKQLTAKIKPQKLRKEKKHITYTLKSKTNGT